MYMQMVRTCIFLKLMVAMSLSLATDGSTHAESDNKNIQCTLEADTAHSQMGPLNALSMYNMTSTQRYTFQAHTSHSQMAGFHPSSAIMA